MSRNLTSRQEAAAPRGDPGSGAASTPTEPLPPPPAARDDDGSDTAPPLAISGKGPMDQTVPDVAAGSTPVTRRDD